MDKEQRPQSQRTEVNNEATTHECECPDPCNCDHENE